MNELNKPKKGDFNLKRIYEGSYQYFNKNTLFCEENFEIFRNKEKLTIQYFSELFSRTKEGELFETRVSYLVNNQFTPIFVHIEKTLGSNHTVENYAYEQRSNLIKYEFRLGNSVETAEITAPTKFHISSNTTVNSLLFLQSKKFDTSNINYYSVLKSKNKWEYESEPEFHEIGVERQSVTPVKIKVDRFPVRATPFKIIQTNPNEEVSNFGEREGIITHVSGFHSIPYKIEDSKTDTTIQIKKLTNLMTEET